MKKLILKIALFLTLLPVLFVFEANAGWKFWKKEENCQSLVESVINKPLIITLLSKNGKDMDYIKRTAPQF